MSGVNPSTKDLPSAIILVVLSFATARSVLAKPDHAPAESLASCEVEKYVALATEEVFNALT